MRLRDRIAKEFQEPSSAQFLSPEEQARRETLRQEYGDELRAALDSQARFESLSPAAHRAASEIARLDRKEAHLAEMAEARAGGGEGIPTQSQYEADRSRAGRVSVTERLLDKSARLEKEMLDSDPRKR
ncbi:MAG TPA: hypothetical protein VGS98_03325 [Thermoanaerobaculia bacterium]|jgi:hypothetical protein|nr:hypothetical protein [Thermoanaerobaculia bacterium]